MRVLVVGPHRSGTSAVAGVLERLGIDMGRPLEGWPTYDSNPLGQYEDPALVRLLDDMIGNWRNPIKHVFYAKAVEALQSWAARRDNEAPTWGAKDPRLCFAAAPLLRAANTKVVIVSRAIAAASASLSAREPTTLPLEVAQHIICEYWRGMLMIAGACSELSVSVKVLSYATLLAEPRESVTKLADFLGVPVTDAAIDYIDPTLCHHD